MRLVLSVAIVAAMAQAPSVDKVPATGGDLTITAISHASVQLEQGGKVVIVWYPGQ